MNSNGKSIAYFCNGLGNFVLLMPALQAVASLSSDKKVDVCINGGWRDGRRPVVEEICHQWDQIGKLIAYPGDRFDPNKYAYWYYTPHGTSCDAVQVFLQHLHYMPVARPSWRGTLIHEADHYMDVAYAMGYEGPPPKVQFPLTEEPVVDLPHPVIGLCNGAFKTSEWRKKHWPHFAKLSLTLKRYFGASIIGIGGPGELDGIPLDIDYSGKLSITQSAFVLSQCDLLITTDTGVMHIGNSMDLPLIALFGSTLISKNGPRGQKSTVLQSGLACAPCQDTGRFYSCNIAACMESISVGDVVSTAKIKLEGNSL